MPQPGHPVTVGLDDAAAIVKSLVDEDAIHKVEDTSIG